MQLLRAAGGFLILLSVLQLCAAAAVGAAILWLNHARGGRSAPSG